MYRRSAWLPVLVLLASPLRSFAAAPWIEESNHYTQMLVDVHLRHSPEYGSSQGLAEYDTRIAVPTLADELAQRAERDAVIAQIKARLPLEKDRKVAEDMQILIHAIDLDDRELDLQIRLDVPFINASERVFRGLKVLLDDQVSAERRPAAVIRLRKYAGVEPGFVPVTRLYKERVEQQMAKPGMTYPSKGELETELGRDSNYIEGIAALFKKYQLTGWEDAYAQLKTQLADYDAWVRSDVLPKARTDFRLPAEEYTLAFEQYGVDLTPADIAAKWRTRPSTNTRPRWRRSPRGSRSERKLPSSDYRAVITELKKTQLTGDAILPFYERRLKDIEGVIVKQQIVTLPDRPAIIRLATAAETVQQPAPHMKPPPLLHNTGQRGEFVLPLNIPSATGGTEDKYDDFTFDAVAWTLTAHEARPGHELQFDSMVEHGVSLARAQYAFNSTNAEGWGLYSEYFDAALRCRPKDSSCRSTCGCCGPRARFSIRSCRRARSTPRMRTGCCRRTSCCRTRSRNEEVERFTFRAPGQANSYFYGYTRLLELRRETEKALGKKFDQKKFHDFILAQGLLPPDLMRKAVLEEFVPEQKSAGV